MRLLSSFQSWKLSIMSASVAGRNIQERESKLLFPCPGPWGKVTHTFSNDWHKPVYEQKSHIRFYILIKLLIHFQTKVKKQWLITWCKNWLWVVKHNYLQKATENVCTLTHWTQSCLCMIKTDVKYFTHFGLFLMKMGEINHAITGQSI